MATTGGSRCESSESARVRATACAHMLAHTCVLAGWFAILGTLLVFGTQLGGAHSSHRHSQQ